MPPTVDGKLASRVGRPAKDEAYIYNIINYSNPLKISSVQGNSFVGSYISKEKVNAGCYGQPQFQVKEERALPAL